MTSPFGAAFYFVLFGYNDFPVNVYNKLIFSQRMSCYNLFLWITGIFQQNYLWKMYTFPQAQQAKVKNL